jgi:tRNA G18 (ribose-2'-O)-methylase SpoU
MLPCVSDPVMIPSPVMSKRQMKIKTKKNDSILNTDIDIDKPTTDINFCNVRDEFKNHSIPELKQIYLDRSTPEIVLFLNPDMDKNIGTILRTSSASFFSKFVIIGRRKTNIITAVGMNHYMPIEYVPACKGNHNEFLDIEKIETYLEDLSKTHTIVLCEISPSSISLNKMNSTLAARGKPPAFLLGNEKDGIPLELIESDRFEKITVEIPSPGYVRSYNVSNSFAMIYWEYIRDR